MVYFIRTGNISLMYFWDRRGRGRMVVAIIAHHHKCFEFESRSGEVYPIQHYVIKFGSNLREVGGFLRALQFLPPIKLTATI